MASIERRMCGGDLAPVEGSTDAACNGKPNGPSAAIPGASGAKEENIRRLIARSAAAQRCIAAGDEITVGLRSGGTVVAVGENEEGECNVSGWKLFNSIDTLEQEIEEGCKAAERRARQQRIEELNRQAAWLREELSNLSEPSTGKRRRAIEERLSEIERELRQLK